MAEKNVMHIKSKNSLLDFNIKEVIKYKYLIFMFVKRDFSVQYKQTILGPLWFILNPLLTTIVFTVIFGNVAGLGTDGIPHFLYYLVGYSIWNYFATCINQTAVTFTNNASIFGKVYFPRIITPISNVLFALINFGVIFGMVLITWAYYFCTGVEIHLSFGVLLVPLLVLQTAALGLGTGIIVSSLTTKYKDLTILVSFGVQLWMYATPVVYSMQDISEKMKLVLLLNPMTPIVMNFRYALLGVGNMETYFWGISIITTLSLLLLGVILFNKIEKSFMDTI